MTTSQRNAHVREAQVNTLLRALETTTIESTNDVPTDIFERAFDNSELYPDVDLVDPYGEDN